ncbi:recombination protein O N-terminal domain-containing protein [Candidatus Uhrbacteria bacterium]|nr:recombination protein O N-terminal domain-containing protein [Candidatus Uhrbacteria bacterium]
MSYVRDRAFILKKEPLREHDRRYTLYGRDHGLLIAVARGASHKRSKQAGHLEPFSEVEVMIAIGRAADKLAVARQISRPAFNTLAGCAVMGAFVDLVSSVTHPGVSDARIFDVLRETRDACAALSTEPTPERARLIHAGAALKLLDLLGYSPPVEGALLNFLRRFPLTDALRVTAAAEVFTATAAFVEDALQHAPLKHAPHGPATIAALLTPAG